MLQGVCDKLEAQTEVGTPGLVYWWGGMGWGWDGA